MKGASVGTTVKKEFRQLIATMSKSSNLFAFEQNRLCDYESHLKSIGVPRGDGDGGEVFLYSPSLKVYEVEDEALRTIIMI